MSYVTLMGDIGEYLLFPVKIPKFLLNIICTGFCLIILAPTAFSLSISESKWAPQEPSGGSLASGIVSTNFTSAQMLMMTIGESDINSPPINVIEGEVTDPNFNVMRNKATNKTTAVAWVVGCLLVATVVPLGTWWYFSR